MGEITPLATFSLINVFQSQLAFCGGQIPGKACGSLVFTYHFMVFSVGILKSIKTHADDIPLSFALQNN